MEAIATGAAANVSLEAAKGASFPVHSSRTALMGEQPNPWNILQPQVAKSRHQGAKPSRRCELLGKISMLSLDQAPFCLCTRGPISVRPEETFARLRYLLGGLRPIETVYLRLSLGL
ncbi:hypothetical protein V6N13_014666 [Hibiscus sabdariffa]